MQTHLSKEPDSSSHQASSRSAEKKSGPALALPLAAAHAETSPDRTLRDLAALGVPAQRAAALHARIDNSPLINEQRSVVQRLTGRATQRQAAGQLSHTTALPSGLKQNIEALSGVSMDGVTVRRNSEKPATVDALATTEGSRIDLGPGQEASLQHEAWHVAQQRQGRVAATTQINGMAVNDQPALEAEADVMGARAMSGSSVAPAEPHGVERAPATSATAVVQRDPKDQQGWGSYLGNMMWGAAVAMKAGVSITITDAGVSVAVTAFSVPVLTYALGAGAIGGLGYLAYQNMPSWSSAGDTPAVSDGATDPAPAPGPPQPVTALTNPTPSALSSVSDDPATITAPAEQPDTGPTHPQSVQLDPGDPRCAALIAALLDAQSARDKGAQPVAPTPVSPSSAGPGPGPSDGPPATPVQLEPNTPECDKVVAMLLSLATGPGPDATPAPPAGASSSNPTPAVESSSAAPATATQQSGTSSPARIPFPGENVKFSAVASTISNAAGLMPGGKLTQALIGAKANELKFIAKAGEASSGSIDDILTAVGASGELATSALELAGHSRPVSEKLLNCCKALNPATGLIKTGRATATALDSGKSSDWASAIYEAIGFSIDLIGALPPVRLATWVVKAAKIAGVAKDAGEMSKAQEAAFKATLTTFVEIARARGPDAVEQYAAHCDELD